MKKGQPVWIRNREYELLHDLKHEFRVRSVSEVISVLHRSHLRLDNERRNTLAIQQYYKDQEKQLEAVTTELNALKGRMVPTDVQKQV